MSCVKLEDLTGRKIMDIIVLRLSHYKHNYDLYDCICRCSVGKDRIPVFTIK